ncbi:MAG: type II toxin-antitoxin system VapC family toxin [Verrucomicrobiaceae bacterium]|jgi:predicted nucleic acid-binding protein|nr:type II toxin-antitoxin system VapC family toxin [Verrucomicrobiaceae bacterium]
MLVDTDILIDYLRGHPEAGSFLESRIDEVSISAVSVAELYQGVREGRERTLLARMVSALTVLPLTTDIAERAGLFRRDYRATTGCGLADCVIAATAARHGLELATLNGKHFRMLERVLTPYLKI